MSKIVLLAALGASLSSAAAAQAQTRDRHAPPDSYMALAPHQRGDVAGTNAPSDQKVMGLQVPNGFRATTGEGQADRY